MNAATNMVNRALGRLGLKITRSRRAAPGETYSPLFRNRSVADLEGLVSAAATIPGMLSEESGKFLFALCYAQQLQGDVIEIGSWQGYSTSFLARAVSESRNGHLYAIDHFRGNAGKESAYVVGKPDLSDLAKKFSDNMQRLGLLQTVKLMEMPNREAAEHLRNEGIRVRFLFIDSDHTREGVQRDVDLFFPFLMKGSIVVFDDCSPSAPGVVETIDRLFHEKAFERAFAYTNSLVAIV